MISRHVGYANYDNLIISGWDPFVIWLINIPILIITSDLQICNSNQLRVKLLFGEGEMWFKFLEYSCCISG